MQKCRQGQLHPHHAKGPHMHMNMKLVRPLMLRKVPV